jgi:hypothetical protein
VFRSLTRGINATKTLRNEPERPSVIRKIREVLDEQGRHQQGNIVRCRRRVFDEDGKVRDDFRHGIGPV